MRIREFLYVTHRGESSRSDRQAQKGIHSIDYKISKIEHG